MKQRVLLFVWLNVSALICGASAFWWSPHSALWLYALAAWALLVVPISFHFYFQWHRRQELADVELALKAWKEHAPGAGTVMARALDEALEEEDEAALQQLLGVLEADASARPFVDATRRWMKNNAGRSSREQHLEEARRAMRPLLRHLSS